MTGQSETSNETMLDLYKLSVEMADRVSARRALTNTFYVTVQAIFFAAVVNIAVESMEVDEWLIAAATLAGVAVSAAWWMTLRSYRDLSAAKWRVISDIETEYLPIEPFKREWAILKSQPEPKAWRERYAEQGVVERYLPWVFAALNIAVLIVTVV